MTDNNTYAPQEVDLSVLWRGIRRRLGWILGAAALLAVLTYFWSRSQPPVYGASATLIASGNQNSDGALGGALVRAPSLPEGAIQQAMQSTLIIEPLLKKLQNEASIPAAEKEQLILKLTDELSAQRLNTITLTSRLDQNSGGAGIYTVSARAGTPESVATLANLASQSLLNWDRDRAVENVRRAAAGYRAQLAQVDQQLADQSVDTLERQTLIARRTTLQTSLANVTILEDATVGVLSRLSNAVQPAQPLAPKPFRNAVLAALLTTLLGLGITAAMILFDRTVRGEDDLLPLNLPTLATIPRLRQRDIVFSGIVRAARQAGLYEAIGFLRVNLLTSLQNRVKPIIMVTSTSPGEGKSSLTATLADGFAASGQRVLIIDADLRRGTQESVWKKFNEAGQWHQLSGTGGVRTAREAFENPANVEVLQVEPNVDMLPAGNSVHDSLSLLNKADIAGALELWRTNYDVVIIDSAPLLALADGLVIGAYADAVLMVAEYGRTNVQAVRQAVRRGERGGLKILGAVINKVDVRDENTYGYSYGYSAKNGVK